ncbi:serine/threonine-protein kinase RsbW [Paracoccus halophilus]|uniref:Serine/threonine protein kinase n=1 Tax=Paracoccus halophilus TaxID=376733 RepID=A0A099F7B3_9RHOB|nr:ATP-binding protein [Paracoccus halophilus]KGJ05982.1 serine/threonine protein kinase [Paracoccus halophilus]SFA54003.1 serine/threonine-protein kinase RsbW [Paracoccus halophilus]
MSPGIATGGQYRLRAVPPGRQPMLHRIFRADPMTVREALVFLHDRFDGSAGDEVIARLELAVAEVLNNISQHGAQHGALPLDGRPHAPLVHLCVARHTGGIACAVTDDGRPLPSTCLEPAALPYAAPGPDSPKPPDISALPQAGYGWFLIRELTASLSYFREGRRNFLAFIVPVNDPLPPADADDRSQSAG